MFTPGYKVERDAFRCRTKGKVRKSKRLVMGSRDGKIF